MYVSLNWKRVFFFFFLKHSFLARALPLSGNENMFLTSERLHKNQFRHRSFLSAVWNFFVEEQQWQRVALLSHVSSSASTTWELRSKTTDEDFFWRVNKITENQSFCAKLRSGCPHEQSIKSQQIFTDATFPPKMLRIQSWVERVFLFFRFTRHNYEGTFKAQQPEKYLLGSFQF